MSGHSVLVSSVSSDLAVWLLDDYVNTVMARESPRWAYLFHGVPSLLLCVATTTKVPAISCYWSPAEIPYIYTGARNLSTSAVLSRCEG